MVFWMLSLPSDSILLKTIASSIIQICSGITRGTVLNGDLYAQRLQNLYITPVISVYCQ